MTRYKLGRLPSVRPPSLGDLDEYATSPLPAPPASFPVPKASYPMDGNDQYGDCTMAGVAHLIGAWDVLFGEHDKVPSSSTIVAGYFKLTGGQDTGLVEADVLKTWQTTGLFGATIAAYAPVSKALPALHQAVAFYGGVYLGIECPESAQDQFSAGEPWTYVKGSPIEGGHCIVGLGYEADGSLLCATWGGIATVTPGFLTHYLDEAWVVISHQLVERKADTLGVDLAQLQADLSRV